MGSKIASLFVLAASSSCAAHTPTRAGNSWTTSSSSAAVRAEAPRAEATSDGSLRASAALEAVRASGVLGVCWQRVVERAPTHPPELSVVTVSVDTAGRMAEIDVGHVCDAALRDCIQRGLAHVRIDAGLAVTAQARFNLRVDGDGRDAPSCASPTTTSDATTARSAVRVTVTESVEHAR